MSGSRVSTGVPMSSAASPCDEAPDTCVYFGQNSTELHSKVFDVEDPWQVLAYDLPAGDEVLLQQASGANEGTFFADVVVNGQTWKLDASNNRMMIPFAGRFRLRYVGQLGQATVVCEPSNCCIGPMFPTRDNRGTAQVCDAFGVPLFNGDPLDV